ncbi:hypothetical protein EXE44_16520 [Halorubrum sp. SS7]|uniref:hypothetical protein n=1 Tax=unclassified Halorubrum TaxID=2642239 RepID=UPI0010F5F2B8|nr:MULTISPECIES: hypothetical protein [unclassified Halorubrum]TKX53031.1 hypothetical protein EXE42_14495 [Halorubrum sp. SP3]TKX55107.1 hypothetical protein EXE44_16520 [Halorubrum sp. SS7]TKX60560.1 hypothetical protein EXE45_17440 [Halorubrum sp. SP9]
MTLTEEDLNELDHQILDVLADGRATPTLVKKLLEKQGTDVSRQYVNRRMKRLSEHDHIQNLLDTGVYEQRADPRKT